VTGVPRRRPIRFVVFLLAFLPTGAIAAEDSADSERVQAELARLTEH